LLCLAEKDVLKGNSVREDLYEAGEMIGIERAVNIVLNADMRVVLVPVGVPAAGLYEGTKTCTPIFDVAIDDKLDIIIASFSCSG